MLLHSTPIERSIERAASSSGLQGTVSERYGLMPMTAPSTELPSSLRFIDDCVAELPWLFQHGKVCGRLMALPVASAAEIRRLDPEHMLRLSMAYGFMAYSFRYSWEHGRERLVHGGEAWQSVAAEDDEERLSPSKGTIAQIRTNILLPWRTLWQAMGREQPCFEGDFFTRNFRIVDGPYRGGDSVGQDNCELLFSIFASETERTFFLGVLEVTARFHCVPALIRMQRAMAEQDHDGVIASVDEITALWQVIVEDVFMRFDTRIDPSDWAATVGTWTASPFPGRDGFSGMFFPAFHMLDILLGRVRYSSMMGKLITHTRAELLPAWRELFDAIGEADLRSYCDLHGREYPELLRVLVRLQEAYQHFFLVHRRKVFAFEYQGIVTGRNSTNAGIAVNIKDRRVESVFSLATWNEIDDLLLESGTERPLERLASTSKCPFSGGQLAEDAPNTFPAPVALRCPFSSASRPPSRPTESGNEALPNWRPLATRWNGLLNSIELESLPVPPRVGDRVVLWMNEAGTAKIEGDFIGQLIPPYLVRTPIPVEELHRIELVRGIFARMPGAGARADHTRDAPVLVLAEARHSVLATTLAGHVRSEFFVVVEGPETEREILVEHGVPREAICVATSLEDLSADEASQRCGQSPTALRSLRNRLLIYVSGGPEFVRRANSWLESAFLEPHEPIAGFLSELRLSKRYRPIVQMGAPAYDERTVMFPWDVIGARRYPLRVVLRERVLDLTQFQAVHYGGTPILRMLAGTDVTPEFSRAHPDGQIRMPEVYTVATFSVPAGLEPLTRLAFVIARSANVLDLLDDTVAPYREQARLRTQRLCRVLEALDVETLWSKALARACFAEIPPAVQHALRTSHARALAVLESSLRGELLDLSSFFAARYTGLYADVLQNLARGLRESVPHAGHPIEKSALNRCFKRHVQILLERGAVARLVQGSPKDRMPLQEIESTASLPRAPHVTA